MAQGVDSGRDDVGDSEDLIGKANREGLGRNYALCCTKVFAGTDVEEDQ